MFQEIEDCLIGLSNNKIVPMEDTKKILENMMRPLWRNTFAIVLEKFTKPTFFEKFESFKRFGELVNSLLTEFINGKDNNNKTLMSVLLISKNIFSKVFFVKV